MNVAGSIEDIGTITYFMYLVSNDDSDDFYQVIYTNGLAMWGGFGRYAEESGPLLNTTLNNTLTATFNISNPTASYTTWGYTEQLSTEGETAVPEKWSDYAPDSYAPYYIHNDTGGNIPPVANVTAGEPYIGVIEVPIRFNGSLSYDLDGNIAKWIWAFGDGTNGSGEIVTHIYSRPGNYTVKLTVTDYYGATDNDTTISVISVRNTPPSTPTIDGPTTGHKNVNYSYTVRSTDSDNDTIQYTFAWGDSTSESSMFLPNGTVCVKNHRWITAGKYTLNVMTSDNRNTSSSEKIIFIDAIDVGEIGYLLDTNGDGTYETFHNGTNNQETSVQQKDGRYLIDSNGDGNPEYTYDLVNGLDIYSPEGKTGTPGFELIFVFSALFVIIYWRHKRN
jgi:PKD repeat protein